MTANIDYADHYKIQGPFGMLNKNVYNVCKCYEFKTTKPSVNWYNEWSNTSLSSSPGQIKYQAHVKKTRNNYKLVTDTPLYVQAVKSGKQLSDVSAHCESYFTGPALEQKWENTKDRAGLGLFSVRK